MLSAAPGVGYIHEPFNPTKFPQWTRTRLPTPYLYVTNDNAAQFDELVARALAPSPPLARELRQIHSARDFAKVVGQLRTIAEIRVLRSRVLVKDPLALFSAPWLARRFNAKVVVMIRHPLGFVSSVKRLGWRFDFREWVDQPLLMRDFLSEYNDELTAARAGDLSDIEEFSLVWSAAHAVIARYRDDHPEWSFVLHEDASQSPDEVITRLYSTLGLHDSASSTRARRAMTVRKSSAHEARDPMSVRRNSAAQLEGWRRVLSEADMELIERQTRDVRRRFYPTDPWL